MAFSPDGTTLATGDYAGVVDVWDVPGPGSSPARSYTVPGLSIVTPVAFSADGSTLAAGAQTGTGQDTVYLWKLAGGSPVTVTEPGTVWGLAFSPAGTLAMADSDGSAYLYDPVTAQRRALPDSGPVYQGVGAVGFSPDGRMIAVGDSAGPVFLWSTGSR